MSQERDLSKLSEKQLQDYHARLAKEQQLIEAEAKKRSGQQAQREFERKVRYMNGGQLEQLCHGRTVDEVANG